MITLAGEAAFQGAADLDMALTEQMAAGAHIVLVDASMLRFADSPIVRLLVLAARTLHGRGGALVLAQPQRAVARMLEIMGADQIIRVESGPEPEESRVGAPSGGEVAHGIGVQAPAAFHAEVPFADEVDE